MTTHSDEQCWDKGSQSSSQILSTIGARGIMSTGMGCPKIFTAKPFKHWECNKYFTHFKAERKPEDMMWDNSFEIIPT